MSGSTVAAPERPGKPPAGPAARARFRPELQGVRALASVLVVVYHVWFDRISGGLDIFFLISGFLITGQVYRALLRGRIELRATWGRMIKRLFPAAMTVLLTIVVVSQFLLPQDRWFQTIREVVAAALFYENWQLASDSVDYFAQHNSASLVQHFWSLSIQGQFYLLWPLLFAGLGLLVRRLGWSLRRTVNLVLGLLFVSSLAYSVYLTSADQPLAYFHGLTRVWEFALGGLLAMFIDAVALPRLLRIVLGWAGVAGIVLCGALLDVDRSFPGWIALWPTVAAGLVLMAGQTESALGADRWLSSKSMNYVGNLSFSLYLWHWPVLVFYLVARDRPAVGLLGGTFVVGVSFLLAIVTYHLIENPVRLSAIGAVKPSGAYRFGVLALAPVLVASGVWQGVSSTRANFEIAVGDPDHPGAVAHAQGYVYRGGPAPSIVPPTVKLADDWARSSKDQCSTSPRNKELQICTEDPEGPPTKSVVLVGDSHIQQYLATFRPAIVSDGWQIKTMLKGACPYSAGSDLMPGDPGCVAWNKAVTDELLETRPDAVVVLSTINAKPGPHEKTPAGFLDVWSTLDKAGIPVVGVRDNPRYTFNMASCVAEKSPTDPACSVPRPAAIAATPAYEKIDDVPDNVTFLDFTDYYCDEKNCRAVVGNVLVYMDDNHPSATFNTTLAPIAVPELKRSLKW
ncbi:acyltransferase family protein [Amycolatopsis benzoatilytica]|uniref:acyltransferase family protein n=1 Tax=Amycolatopsis benzoatilytica TaxID=346045 RepID=UPI0003747526|nr:acyltransferase family protein [Amycolatopsis benzoatilytica]